MKFLEWKKKTLMSYNFGGGKMTNKTFNKKLDTILEMNSAYQKKLAEIKAEDEKEQKKK